MKAVFLRSLAVHLPTRAMPNRHWVEHHPEMIRDIEQLALNQTWSGRDGAETDPFDAAMGPYRADPFRGCQDRWWLNPGEPSLPNEVAVAQQALASAQLEADALDAVLVTSFPADQMMVGNGAYLVRELGIDAPAWNLESACGSWFGQLEIATALIRSGRAKNILVVTSCAYSRAAPSKEVISIANGDAFCAAIVSDEGGAEIRSHVAVNTASSCGALSAVAEVESGEAVLRMRLDRTAGKKIRTILDQTVKRCTQSVLDGESAAVGDVGFWAMNAATAWQVAYYADVLGFDPSRSVNTHPHFANIGPVLTPASLYFGALLGRIQEQDLVVCFGIGNTSTAGALALRWGDCRLGELQPHVVGTFEAMQGAHPPLGVPPG